MSVVVPIVRRNLSDQIHCAIKEGIVRWEFRPGQRLIDSDLAIQFGVSRSLVRNAITSLVNEGLVEVAQRRFYVTRFSQKDIYDLLQLRHVLELTMLPVAMADLAAHDVDAMEARMTEAEVAFRARDIELFYAVDVATHQMIIDHCGNDQIKKVYSNLSTQLRIVIRSGFDEQSGISKSLIEHRALIDALKRRDVAAATVALDRHLNMAESRVMEKFAQLLGELELGESPVPRDEE